MWIDFDTWYRTQARVAANDQRPLYFKGDPEITMIQAGLIGAGAYSGGYVNTSVAPNKNQAETWQNYATRISAKAIPNMATATTTTSGPEDKLTGQYKNLFDALKGVTNPLITGLTTVDNSLDALKQTVGSTSNAVENAAQANAAAAGAGGISQKTMLIIAAVIVIVFLFRKKLF